MLLGSPISISLLAFIRRGCAEAPGIIEIPPSGSEVIENFSLELRCKGCSATRCCRGATSSLRTSGPSFRALSA